MKLQGRPLWNIHRFGKCFSSDEFGYIEAKTKEEEQIFKGYGFKEVKSENKQENKQEKKEKTDNKSE